MTNEQLCALALTAIDDYESRLVLSDAVDETGWDHPLMFRWYDRYFTDEHWWAKEKSDESPCREWSIACAAVLLFGDWPTAWPLAERCRFYSRGPFNAYRLGGWSVASPTQDDD